MCVEHDALRNWRLEAVVQNKGTVQTRPMTNEAALKRGPADSSQCT